MGKAEENYKYLLNKDKYDPEVQQAVGKKSLSEKDANKVNDIQEMMRKEREKTSDKAKKSTKSMRKKATVKEEMKKYSENPNRTIVTSENLNDFIAEKLKLNKD